MGMTDAFAPIPIPSKIRVMKSSHQLLLKADPMTENKQKIPDTKIVPRRPKKLFSGSDSQQPRRAAPM